MRFPALVLCLLPVGAWADDIVLNAPVTDVIAYAAGATITRTAQTSIPAGNHTLIFRDLPLTTDLDTLRIAVPQTTLGELTLRRRYVPPRDTAPSPALEAAEDRIDAVRTRIDEVTDSAAAARAVAEAAMARAGFLTALPGSEGAQSLDADTLRATARMIGEEVLAARQAALDAGIRARGIEAALEDLTEELRAATRARDALVPEAEDRAFAAVAVSLDAPFDGRVTATYSVPPNIVSWTPVYDMRLDRSEPARLTIDRGASVRQATGENWTDVALTLSTLIPGGQTAPGVLYPQQRSILDPAALGSTVRMQSKAADTAEFAAAPVVQEEAAASIIAGLGVEYSYPGTVSVASGADAVRISLGSVQTPATLRAVAIPLLHDTAFLMARITNDTGELILPSDRVSSYVDGVLVGQGYGAAISAGATVDLPFGPIDGLRLARRTLDANEGDRGVIRRSNERTDRFRIEIENLTDLDWDLHVEDRVPYSEQEDLEIDWQAQPAPTETDPEDRRGILVWDMAIRAGETREILLEQTLSWPTDKQLR